MIREIIRRISHELTMRRLDRDIRRARVRLGLSMEYVPRPLLVRLVRSGTVR